MLYLTAKSKQDILTESGMYILSGIERKLFIFITGGEFILLFMNLNRPYSSYDEFIEEWEITKIDDKDYKNRDEKLLSSKIISSLRNKKISEILL